MINELRKMAIFAMTIDHGSFRAAARAMKLSPSVVSHQISELEKQLGTALIYRSTRNLSLTHDGEKLLQSARSMLAAAELGLQSISERAAEPSGELRITMPSVLTHSKIVKQLSGFLKEYPKIHLSVDFSDTRKNIIDDGFDIAIRMGWLKDSALISRKLSDVSRKLVAAKSYFETQTLPKHPAELNDLDWVELAPVRGKKEVFKKTGHKSVVIKPTSRISVNDAYALYQFAQSGSGLALVPEFLAEADVHDAITEYILPDWHVEQIGVYAVWPQNAVKNSLTKVLVNYLAR